MSDMDSEELVIDMTLSEDEECVNNGEKTSDGSVSPAANSPEPALNSPLPMETDEGNFRTVINDVPLVKDMPPAQKTPNLIPSENLNDIMSNYSASELARVTTQVMIECIGRFPALWDSKNPNYHNHNYNCLLWSNIAGVLNMPVKKARQKWGNIRSAYRREYFKTKDSGVPSRYHYYKYLGFLEKEVLRDKRKALKGVNFQIGGNPQSPNAESDEDDCWLIDGEDDDTTGNSSTKDCISENLEPNVGESNRPVEPTNVPEMNDSSKPSNPIAPQKLVRGASTVETVKLPIIRPKKIADLMPLPLPVISGTTSLAVAGNEPVRSPSPEVIFVSEKVQNVPKVPCMTISRVYPSLSSGEVPGNASSNPAVTKRKKSKKSKSALNSSPSSAEFKSAKSKKAKRAPLQISSSAVDPLAQYSIPTESAVRSPPTHSKNTQETTSSLQEEVNLPTPAPLPYVKKDKRRNDYDINRGFLLSLLPDVENMTNAQFRRLKKRATDLVSIILDN